MEPLKTVLFSLILLSLFYLWKIGNENDIYMVDFHDTDIWLFQKTWIPHIIIWLKGNCQRSSLQTSQSFGVIFPMCCCLNHIKCFAQKINFHIFRKWGAPLVPPQPVYLWILFRNTIKLLVFYLNFHQYFCLSSNCYEYCYEYICLHVYNKHKIIKLFWS